MAADENTHLLLGEIKGKVEMILDNQNSSNERFEARFDGIDSRLRKVEVKGGINGAITGGIVAVGFELIKAKFNGMFGGS